MTHDDRIEFERARRDAATRMRADPELAAAAVALDRAADRHDWLYQWSWLGLPVIQTPSDIVAVQEIIWSCRPQLVIETGVARGGSVVLSASILQLLGEGHVLGIDIDIRAHNRAAIEAHPLAHRITLLEGSSVATDVVDIARARAAAVDRVMVILDSNHTHDHVLAELGAYSSLVSVDQFLVVCDTHVEDIGNAEHRPRPWGPGNSPGSALHAWLAEIGAAGSPVFEPDAFVNDKLLVSSSQGGYLRRVR